jgi:hypothetical protein
MKKALTLQQFVDAFPSNYDSAGIYHVNGGKWVAKVMHGHLTKPDGTEECDCLGDLLADLATVGIRKIQIESDGFPSSGRNW